MEHFASGRFALLAAETVALAAALRLSLVRVTDGRGHGSGVIWDDEGLIVTSHHVVTHESARVELADGRRLPAVVVGRDWRNDLAALRVAARDLPAAAIGDSRSLRVGELLLAVGHPFDVRGAVTLGIVSAAGSGTWMGRSRREVLQADVSLAPGSSGGPLADAAGRVVGIASMIAGPGIAIAVPSHVVRRFVAELEGARV
jgi:S1-C subfamily serine protease